MGAVLRLERFDLDTPPMPEIHTAEDLQDAYARGMAEGREQTRREDSAALGAALAQLSARLAETDAALAADGRRRAEALGPLVAALVDGVLPRIARARLEAAMLAELLQLSEAVTPLEARLRCGPDLLPFVAACVAEAGIRPIAITADGPEGTVEAELLGGTITWDVAEVARQLQAMLQEIMEYH